MSDINTSIWLTSVQVMQRTGISRATLNNYIRLGILPRPVVKSPDSGSSRIKKIGHFPEPVIETIEKVRDLKKRGVLMEQMANYLVGNEKFRQIHPVPHDEATPRPKGMMTDNITLTVADTPHSAKQLLDRSLPSLVSLCVLVADLQDSVKISAELPPAEYFELINGLWQNVSGSFEKYQGIYGKHSGDGILYYFLKKPNTHYIMDSIACAVELRACVKEFSNQWKKRKGWLNELYLNVGINEGKEFFGTIRGPLNSEFTALGDSINYAGRLSDFARFGGILITKNTLTRLTSEELKQIRYGVRRKNQDREIFIENTFSRVMDLIDIENQSHFKHKDISTLPITEIVDFIPSITP